CKSSIYGVCVHAANFFARFQKMLGEDAGDQTFTYATFSLKNHVDCSHSFTPCICSQTKSSSRSS
ncbi:hypothetical protein ADUPG1_004518, partial [Aduncisulcus paluster]